MANGAKQIGMFALWAGSVAHLVMGVGFLTGLAGGFIQSITAINLLGFGTVQGLIGGLSLWALSMMAKRR